MVDAVWPICIQIKRSFHYKKSLLIMNSFLSTMKSLLIWLNNLEERIMINKCQSSTITVNGKYLIGVNYKIDVLK